MLLTLLRPRSAPSRKRRKVTQKGATDYEAKRAEIEARIEASRQITDEITERFAREYVEQAVEFKPVDTMSAAEIDHEIGVLLHEKMKADEDEMIMLLLIAAST